MLNKSYIYGELLTPQIVEAQNFINNFIVPSSSDGDMYFDGTTFIIKNSGIYQFEFSYCCEGCSTFSLYDIDKNESVQGTYVGTVVKTESEMTKENNYKEDFHRCIEGKETDDKYDKNDYLGNDRKNKKMCDFDDDEGKESDDNYNKNEKMCDSDNDDCWTSDYDDCLTSDYENETDEDKDGTLTNAEFDTLLSGTFKKVNPGVNIVKHNAIVTVTKNQTRYQIKNNLDIPVKLTNTYVNLTNTSANSTNNKIPVAKVLFYRI